MERLRAENDDLKKQLDAVKRHQKFKLDELRILLGIECDLEAILKAKPNTKEMQQIKLYREAKEMAETRARLNRDIKKKVETT